MNDQIVYVLTNEAMPGYVKIGMTTNLSQRMQSLDGTNLPLPFECFFACIVNDARRIETSLHRGLSDHRVRSSREFFEIAPERVVDLLEPHMLRDITPGKEYIESHEDKEALNKAKQRRSVFNFEMAGIPIGATLVFSRDDSKTARVVDNRSVELNGQITSLSTSAQNLLGVQYPVAGTEYWVYEGELLDERRRRLESGL